MYVIITSALQEGEKVPTARELATFLLLESATTKAISPTAAKLVNDRLLKLQGEHHFLFKKRKGLRKSKAWYLDVKTVVTESETALYLVTLVENTRSTEGKISKLSFHQHLTATYDRFTPTELDRIYPLVNHSGYLHEIGEDLRPGERTHAQLPYLQLRANDFFSQAQ